MIAAMAAESAAACAERLTNCDQPISTAMAMMPINDVRERVTIANACPRRVRLNRRFITIPARYKENRDRLGIQYTLWIAGGMEPIGDRVWSIDGRLPWGAPARQSFLEDLPGAG